MNHIKGSDLIIKANGSVLAASKSCDVNVQADTIAVSSPTDGTWVHRIAGRKSWSVITNHIMLNVEAAYSKITVESPRFSTGVTSKVSGLIDATLTGTGLHFYIFRQVDDVWVPVFCQTYNTINSTEMDNLVNELEDTANDGDIQVLASGDTFFINSDLQSVISTRFNIPTSQIPVITSGISPRAFCAIGSMNTGSAGIANYHEGRAAGVHATAYYIDSKIQTLESVVSNDIDMVGTEVELSMLLNGHGADLKTGPAICKQFRVTGTRGNLLQGSFSFEGSGPLE